MAAGADIAARDSLFEKTPLHAAARSNENPAVVEALLTAGADIGARNDLGETPLHEAARSNGNPAVVEVLLAAGADMGTRGGVRDGSTPLHEAARSNENPAVVEALLTAGADIGARNDLGETPLHEAARFNETPAVVEVLLAAGADIAARDDDGQTPLHVAARWNDENPTVVVEALLTAGADVETRDDDGATPLHAWGSVAEVITKLFAVGANLEARTTSGMTPLHFAVVGSDQAAAIEALLALGANLEARDADGNTPLHEAASWFNVSDAHAGPSIAALLDAGANPLARNAAGQTPWDLAQQNEALQGSPAYWRLNDARFNAPSQDVQPDATGSARPQPGAVVRPPRQGPACEVPGYPTPANVESIGLSWCGPSVGFQRRAFAVQAAGAWCAIAEGTSSTPEQISARHQEINAACDTLDALGSLGGPPCRCPAGYRP